MTNNLYIKKYKKYKNKYSNLVGGTLDKEHMGMCNECYKNTGIVSTCRNRRHCFRKTKNGIEYKLWNTKIYGRTFYGWSETGTPPTSFDKNKKNLINNTRKGIITKFKKVYDNLPSESKTEIDQYYPNIVPLVTSWLGEHKMYILDNQTNPYHDFEDAFGDEGDDGYDINKIFTMHTYTVAGDVAVVDFINNINDITEFFRKNELYQDDLILVRNIKQDRDKYCNPEDENYWTGHTSSFCSDSSLTPKLYPDLDTIYNLVSGSTDPREQLDSILQKQLDSILREIELSIEGILLKPTQSDNIQTKIKRYEEKMGIVVNTKLSTTDRILNLYSALLDINEIDMPPRTDDRIMFLYSKISK